MLRKIHVKFKLSDGKSMQILSPWAIAEKMAPVLKSICARYLWTMINFLL